MRVQTVLVLLLCLLACGGCNNGKSTDELIADLKSGTEIEGVIAARTLPRGKNDAEKVVPALIEGLTHRGNDVRRSSALKLGEFHELAKDAIPALQKAEEHDGDARVREAAGIALSHRSGTISLARPRQVGDSFTKTLIRGSSVPARSLILTAGPEAPEESNVGGGKALTMVASTHPCSTYESREFRR